MPEGCIGIVGAAGFIGTELARQAHLAGWRVVGFSRAGREATDVAGSWRTWTDSPDLAGLDVLVNLAGHPIEKRWNDRNRRLFQESRIGVTRYIARALSGMQSSQRPSVVINGSAIGIYGDRGDELLDEESAPGEGYLAELCAEWERTAGEIASLGVRTVMLRTGMVLGREGMAFRKMCAPLKWGVGGRLGSGRQWMSWVRVEDLAAAVLHLAMRPEISGPVNGCSPEPLRNAEFTEILAKKLHRRAWLAVPAPALKLALGGFASAVLSSLRAVPKVLLESGFRFRYPRLSDALGELL